jgi:hypothetical protein
VLIYCSIAIESALSARRERVTADDLLNARKRFSDSRLKDLGDEYAENYPNIAMVLSRFYGLGVEYTYSGVTSFIQKLLVDDEVKHACATWIFRHTVPEQLVELLYSIGFMGISKGGKADQIVFRSAGARSTAPPGISTKSRMRIHESYHAALNLHDEVVATLEEATTLRTAGIVDLPEGSTLDNYQDQLDQLAQELETMPTGSDSATQFEEVVGRIIRLCFFRYLTNVEPRVRNASGTKVRDWICSNSAQSGIWEHIRVRYGASQIVWECKNYEELHADDFHQAQYYMNGRIGRCAVIAFRGNEFKRSYKEHVKEIASNCDGLVLLFTQRDLEVFVRQAKHGKFRDGHVRDIHDRIVRDIS